MEVGSTLLLAKQWRWPCFEAPFGFFSVRLGHCGGVRKPFRSNCCRRTGRLLRLHFEHLPFPADSTLWYLAPATALLSTDFSEGRMLSCLMDARPSPLHSNSVAGELFGLVPALRRAHVALRIWLARDHPSNLCVVPDILRTEWEGARDTRAFAIYLQHDLGVMTEHPAVARSSAAAWMVWGGAPSHELTPCLPRPLATLCGGGHHSSRLWAARGRCGFGPLGSPVLRCRCCASCALPCRQAEPCAVSGFSPAKTRAVRGATALPPWRV